MSFNARIVRTLMHLPNESLLSIPLDSPRFLLNGGKRRFRGRRCPKWNVCLPKPYAYVCFPIEFLSEAIRFSRSRVGASTIPNAINYQRLRTPRLRLTLETTFVLKIPRVPRNQGFRALRRTLVRLVSNRAQSK